MRKIFLLFSFFIFAQSVSAQGDTAIVSFKKFFRWKPLPYDASYNNKEFEMDSIWNSVENNGYIKYRAEVLPKPLSSKIPRHLQKRFIKMDTVAYSETGDSMINEFFALGYVGSIKNVFCFLIERQLTYKSYRSSEKFLCTFDRRFKMIDRLLLSHEIPGAPSTDNFDVFSDNFNQLTWFEETKGIVFEDLTIEMENEIGKVSHYKLKDNGHFAKRIFKVGSF